MKLRELLLELRELLDRTEYGAWIDPQNKIHPVPHEGHQLFIEEYLVDQGYNPEQVVQLDYDQIYGIAFKLGFVRTMHEMDIPGGGITIEGSGKALKRVASIIMATAVQPDIKLIGVNKAVSGDATTSFKQFIMPTQREELKLYLQSG